MNNKGFTIVELLVSMTFFSFILLLIFVGFVQINRSYSRGLTVKEVQNSTRNLTEDLVRTIRNTNSVDEIILDPAGYRICVGGIRYAWNQYDDASSSFTDETYASSTDQIKIVKIEDNLACSADIDQANSKQLIDNNHRVQYLSVEPIGSKTYNITVVLSSYVIDDFTSFGKNASCKIRSGDQYCAIAKIETTVTSRN